MSEKAQGSYSLRAQYNAALGETTSKRKAGLMLGGIHRSRRIRAGAKLPLFSCQLETIPVGTGLWTPGGRD